MDSDNEDFEEYLELTHFVEFSKRPSRRYPHLGKRDPFSVFNDAEFKIQYGFSKETTLRVFELFEEELTGPRSFDKHSISPLEQLLITLHVFRSNSFMWATSTQGHILRSTASICRVVSKVSDVIGRRMHEVVRLPNAAEEETIEKATFEKFGFPSVRGFLDGSHIEISPPRHLPKYAFVDDKVTLIRMKARTV